MKNRLLLALIILFSIASPVSFLTAGSTEMEDCLAPSIVQCSDGSLMVAFTGSLGNRKYHLYVSASDDGEEWSTPIQVTEQLISSDSWPMMPSLIQLQDGSYMVAYFQDKPGEIIVKKSRDGETWSDPVKAYSCERHIAGVSLIQCHKGSYMIAFKKDTGDGDSIYVITSEDGEEWSSSTPVFHMDFDPEGNLLGEQPSLIQKNDDSFIITSVHYAWKKEEYYVAILGSEDGNDWRLRGHPQIPSSYFFDTSLIQCQDQSHMIAYDSNAGGEANIYVMSSNQGSSWSKPVKVTVESDSSQPSLIQLKNGSYIIAYMMDKEGGKEINVIKSPDGLKWSLPVTVTGETDPNTAIQYSVDQTPENPWPGSEVKVTAEARTRLSDIESVTLYYMVDDGLWRTREMDKIESWKGTIPGQKFRTKVRYFLLATRSDEYSVKSDTHSYTVGSSILLSIGSLALGSIAGITIVIYMTKKTQGKMQKHETK